MKKSINSIQSISVVAKEWFDKINGNSYFSFRLTVTLKDGKTIERSVPMQYGYGDSYLWEAAKEFGILFECEQSFNLSRFCRENKITCFTSKHEKCLQRDVKAWGKN